MGFAAAGVSTLLVLLPLSAQGTLNTLLWDGSALLHTRATIEDPTLRPAVAELRRQAAMAEVTPPLSVTSKTHPPAGGDLHDYVTFSSYFWPCTATCNHTLFQNCSQWFMSTKPCNHTSGLPWVGHDGYNDPASALDRPRWSTMVSAVNALSASAFFFNNTAHAEHAALLLRVWFLDNKTFMRPDARFAQLIPGSTDPHTPGLIDFSDGADPGGGGNYDTTVSLAHLLDHVKMLAWAAPEHWSAQDMAGMETWLREWLEKVESPAERDDGPNNRGTFYSTLVASCAFFVGNYTSLTHICDSAPQDKIARQISPDGRLPAEDARTKSKSYHSFAMVALLDLAWLCRAASPQSPDLFTFETSDGKSLRGAVEWLAPYANGRPWDAGAQVRPFDPSVFTKIFHTAAVVYPDSKERFAAIAGKQPNATKSLQLLLRPYR